MAKNINTHTHTHISQKETSLPTRARQPLRPRPLVSKTWQLFLQQWKIFSLVQWFPHFRARGNILLQWRIRRWQQQLSILKNPKPDLKPSKRTTFQRRFLFHIFKSIHSLTNSYIYPDYVTPGDNIIKHHLSFKIQTRTSHLPLASANKQGGDWSRSWCFHQAISRVSWWYWERIGINVLKPRLEFWRRNWSWTSCWWIAVRKLDWWVCLSPSICIEDNIYRR